MCVERTSIDYAATEDTDSVVKADIIDYAHEQVLYAQQNEDVHENHDTSSHDIDG